MISRKMIEVMGKISAIDKSRKNTMQGYSFRGIDDVYNELHAIMAEVGVFCIPRVVSDRSEDRQSSKGGVLIYRILTMEFDFIAEDGSKVTACVIGEGMDSGDKASNKAMSVAQKYALLQAFLIPTAEPKDPENDSPVVAPAPKKANATDKMRAELMAKLNDMPTKEEKVAYMQKHWGISSIKDSSDEVIADLHKRVCA